MQCPQPGLEPGPLDPEMSVLAMRPPLKFTTGFSWPIDGEINNVPP